MMSKAGWERFGSVLHRSSYLKVGFYLLGFYYEFLVFFGDRGKFVHNLCSMLFMFGLAMLLEGLRDNELTAKKRYKNRNARLDRYQWIVVVAVVGFSLVVLLGLFCLFFLRDKFQGEAILTFGIGGLAFFRLEYDCLSHALSLREKAEAAPPVLPSRVSKDAAIAGAIRPPEADRPTPPAAIP